MLKNLIDEDFSAAFRETPATMSREEMQFRSSNPEFMAQRDKEALRDLCSAYLSDG